MTPPSSAREALIVEALGEVARLLDRDEAASDLMVAQTQAMASAARLVFSEQADSNLSRLCKLLQQVVHRVDRPWEIWMTHAATAGASALLTWCVYSEYTIR